jgi:polyadenylate-binding protein
MNIFVSNLCETTNEQHIRELFMHFGPVISVQLIMSNDTGKSEKFAFVEMASDTDGTGAIEKLDNMLFMGCYLDVKEVRNKKDKKTT